jgi:hypothetical protein
MRCQAVGRWMTRVGLVERRALVCLLRLRSCDGRDDLMREVLHLFLPILFEGSFDVGRRQCQTHHLTPQPPHRLTRARRFAWSEGFDRIFRNEGVTGSNPPAPPNTLLRAISGWRSSRSSHDLMGLALRVGPNRPESRRFGAKGRLLLHAPPSLRPGRP